MDRYPGRYRNGKATMAAVVVALFISLILGCTSTRTSTSSSAASTEELELRVGDEVRLITARRERFRMVIHAITAEGLNGETVAWEGSRIAPGQPVMLPFHELAFIQVDRPSPLKTADAVATVTMAGALVYLVSVAPVTLLFP
jgi:hypothetical protein